RPVTRLSELRSGQPRIGELRPDGARDREPRLTKPRISVLRPEPRVSELRRADIRSTEPGPKGTRDGETRDGETRLARAGIGTLRQDIAGCGARGLIRRGIGALRPVQPRPGTFRVGNSWLCAPRAAVLRVGRSWLPVAAGTRPLGPGTAATGLTL